MQATGKYHAASFQVSGREDTLCFIDCLSDVVPSCVRSVLVETRRPSSMVTVSANVEETREESTLRLCSGTADKRIHRNNEEKRKRLSLSA